MSKIGNMLCGALSILLRETYSNPYLGIFDLSWLVTNLNHANDFSNSTSV